MKDSTRRYEEMQRVFNRIQKLYDGGVISSEGEDSFQSPKDHILNFFRCSYEFKERISTDYPTQKKLIEKEVSMSDSLSLCIDIANKKKHSGTIGKRTGKVIGEINTHIYILNLDGKSDRTETSINIDNIKIDCLSLIKDIMDSRTVLYKRIL